MSARAASRVGRRAERARRRFAWLGDAPRHIVERLLRDHAIPVAATVSIGLLAMAVVDVRHGLAAAHEQRRTLSSMCAALAAEEAAFAAMRTKITGRVLRQTSWKLTACIDRVRDVDERLEITVEAERHREHFWCECLRGAAPACFGRRLTLGDAAAAGGDGVQGWLHGAGDSAAGPLPQLAPPRSLRKAVPGLTCDSEVAFLHLPAGTDRTDYTLGKQCDQVAPTPDAQVVEVRGNLWVLPSSRPLTFALRAPLTLVVRGNLYLGRSLLVTGGHPLTIVAQRGGATFRDLDGDGACTPTEPLLGSGSRCVEGEGSLYLGLPRVRNAAEQIIEAHLVATGEIHLLAPTRLDGALVGAHGITRCRKAATLTLTGRLLVEVGRTRVPGFATSGSPRPGRLHRVAPGE